jgi:hypothetical protein
MKMRGKIGLAIVMALFPAIAIWGNTVTIQPGPDIGQDTDADPYYPNDNFGDREVMYVGNGERSFLRFGQLSWYLGYEINSAELHVWYANYDYYTASADFCRILGPWDEDLLTWSNQPNHSNSEYVHQSFPQTEYEPIESIIDVTWMVQKWLSGEWDNCGWCMTGLYPFGIATSNDTYSTERPKLVLTGPNLPPLAVQPTSLGKVRALFSP